MTVSTVAAPTATAVEAALDKALRFVVTPERASGCGRVYVVIVDKEQAKLFARPAKKLGMIWQRKAHYGLSNALYVGYDNATGRELARGTAVVEALKAIGIKCYRSEHGD